MQQIASVEFREFERPPLFDIERRLKDTLESVFKRELPVQVLRQFREGRQSIMGLMLESNLNSGKQTWKQGVALVHGVSITDACLGWNDTAALLNELSESIVTRPA